MRVWAISYGELKVEMAARHQQMVEAEKNERANALKRVKASLQRVGNYCGYVKRGTC